MTAFIKWLNIRLKKDDSKVTAIETFEGGRALGKDEGMKRIAELEQELAKYIHTPKAYATMEENLSEVEAELDQCLTVHAKLNDDHEKMKTKFDWMKVET